MDMKKLFIIILVVCALFGLVAVKKAVRLRQEAALTASQQASDVELTKDLTASFLSGIVVYEGSEPDKKLVVSKDTQGHWIIASLYGVRARSQAIDDILNGLRNLKGELRADSKDVLADFGIEDAKGLHVILESEGKTSLSHLVVSLKNPQLRKSFVRRAGSTQVVLVNKDVPGFFHIFDNEGVNAEFLADLKLFTFETKDIKKIIIAGKGALVFTRNESWNMEPAPGKQETLDQEAVNRLVSDVLNMNAREVVDPAGTSYGFDKPLLTMVMEDAAGNKPVQLEVGNIVGQGKGYYIRVPPAKFVYKINEDEIGNIKKDRGAFLKVPEPVKPAPAAPAKPAASPAKPATAPAPAAGKKH